MASANLYDDQKEFYGKSADSFTSFDEQIVSTATPLISLKSTYGYSELRDRRTVTGSGTVTVANGLYAVSTGATAGSMAVLESSEYGRYIAGFDAVAGLGGFLNREPILDEVVRWGYFSSQNGFGFGKDKDGNFTFVRKAGVDRVQREDDWKGDSLSYDTTVFNIYRMPHRWYGEGPINFEVFTAGTFGKGRSARVNSVAASPGEIITEEINLPIRVEVENGTNDSDLTFNVGGRQFFVQGLYIPKFRSTSEFVTGVTASSGVLTPIITFQQKAGFADVAALLKKLTITCVSNDVHWIITIGGTVTGGTFGSITGIPDTETAFEVKTNATGVTTEGIKIAEDLAVAGQGNSSGGRPEDLPEIDLPKDVEVTVLAEGLGGDATVNCVFALKEEW